MEISFKDFQKVYLTLSTMHSLRQAGIAEDYISKNPLTKGTVLTQSTTKWMKIYDGIDGTAITDIVKIP